MESSLNERLTPAQLGHYQTMAAALAQFGLAISGVRVAEVQSPTCIDVTVSPTSDRPFTVYHAWDIASRLEKDNAAVCVDSTPDYSQQSFPLNSWRCMAEYRPSNLVLNLAYRHSELSQ